MGFIFRKCGKALFRNHFTNHDSRFVHSLENEMSIVNKMQTSSEGVKEFAELGTTAALDKDTSAAGEVLDAFSAPPIGKGKGRSEAKMFIDGNHTRVSGKGNDCKIYWFVLVCVIMDLCAYSSCESLNP